MNRREAGLNLLGGGPEQRHAMETLRVGSLALMTSQLAQTRAGTFRVTEFAGFEVNEQTTIAHIIQSATGMVPPPPDPEAQAMMDRLQRASGRDFEAQYITMQIDGHRRLLAIQERYLASGRLPDFRHVAMLARVSIQEHLRLLSDIQSNRV